MPTNTTTYSFQKPVVGADEDSWGGYLNSNWDKVDDLFDGTTAITGIDINSGTIDGTVIGATTPAAITGTTGQFNTSLNVDGTITSDGLTVDGDNASIVFTGTTGNNFITVKQGLRIDIDSDDNQGATSFGVTHGGGTGNVLIASENGDISFYEDTGTTAKFFWDASEEMLTTSALTVDGNISAGLIGGFTGTSPRVQLLETDTTDENTAIIQSGGQVSIRTMSDDTLTTTRRLAVDHGTGDISFYEDTGTTAKFFWDASDQRLTIDGDQDASSLATSVTSSVLELNGNSAGSAAAWFGGISGGGQYVQSANGTGTTAYDFLINPYGGSVGIGTDLPASILHANGTDAEIRLQSSSQTTNLGKFRIDPANNKVVLESTSSHALAFNTNGSERMRIDSSGNLLVGKTASSSATVGIEPATSPFSGT